MSWILGISGVLCFIYFVAIMVFSGPGTSFAFIWLVLALVFGLAASGKLVGRLSGAGLPLSVRVAAATLFVTGLVVFVIVEILVFTGVTQEDPKGLDYVIVLGAKVQQEGVSKSLKMRLDKANQYGEENHDTIFVLSGGKGKDERRPRLFGGLAPGDLAIEAPEKPVQIGVLTSNFHLFRAVQIGKKWGIPDIQGIAAPSELWMLPHFCVRECAAILKDKLMGNM